MRVHGSHTKLVECITVKYSRLERYFGPLEDIFYRESTESGVVAWYHFNGERVPISTELELEYRYLTNISNANSSIDSDTMQSSKSTSIGKVPPKSVPVDKDVLSERKWWWEELPPVKGLTYD